MSADNGVYVLETKDGFRVAELMAVENYLWDEEIGGDTTDQDVWIKNAREMWANSPHFKTEEEAMKYAKELYDKIMKDFGIVEYGISFITIDRNFKEE